MKNSTNVSEHTSSFRRAQGRALLAPTQPALAPRSPEGVGGDSLTLGTSGDHLPRPSPLDPWLDNQPLGRCFKQRGAVVSVLLHRGKILPLCLPSIVSNGLPSGIEGTKARAALSPPQEPPCKKGRCQGQPRERGTSIPWVWKRSKERLCVCSLPCSAHQGGVHLQHVLHPSSSCPGTSEVKMLLLLCQGFSAFPSSPSWNKQASALQHFTVES